MSMLGIYFQDTTVTVDLEISGVIIYTKIPSSQTHSLNNQIL